jgi:site-specific recombinase XerD
MTIYGSQKASHRIPKYLSFFVSLDVRYPESHSISARNLIKTFGAETLRRNGTAVNFLIRAEIFPPFLRKELDHYNEGQRQEKMASKVEDEWYGRFFSQFHSHALKLQQLSLDRGNKGPSAKTISTWMRAAKKFLEYIAKKKGAHALTQIETSHLDLFLAYNKGYKTTIRPFIRFLNKEGKIFKPVRQEKILNKNTSRLIMDFGVFDRLVAHCLEPETPAKEALFGVLMLLYAQTPTRISKLKLSQLGRNSKGVRTILFFRVALEIDPEIDRILTRWLKERKALSIHESEHDNPYIFPGRRQGDRISPESISYYYKKWGASADEILASSLFQMYCNGVRHPNAPHNAFGLSKAVTGKYLQMFDAHYHDAVNEYQKEKLEKGKFEKDVPF